MQGKIFVTLFLVMTAAGLQAQQQSQPVKIQWTKTVPGDFSFRKRWNYPEGVYKNSFGQLSCDGLCPEGTDVMKNSKGKIYKDSLAAFYKLVDTTHQYHSIAGNAACYEWAGTDYIEVSRTAETDSVYAYTPGNAATHSSLQFIIANGYCIPRIECNSVQGENRIFYCTQGSITIDSALWKKGIMKAAFDFRFYNGDDKTKPFYWKGRIYAAIVCKENSISGVD